MSDRTIRVVPGYGAGLRRQLEAVEWTQSRLVSESQVSRQTISRAVNRDEVSDRTRAKIDAALGRAPEDRFATPSRNPRSRSSPLGHALCDATDLVAWADRRNAQSDLPLVIRRLILATGAGVAKLHFRTGEGIYLAGWDGIVSADRGTPFVPKGISGWEMSVGAPPKKKADENWDTRTKDGRTLEPGDATFVFVTPRRWSEKEEWAAEKTDYGLWRDVRVLDADDLAAWLEDVPAVHTWLSIQIGKVPRDTLLLESHWKEWSGATNPALPRRLLLSGRQESVRDLRRRLSNVSGQAFAIQAESQEEAIAWLYCGIRELGPEQAETILARCLVVKSAEAFRHLLAARSPLVLIPTFHPEELAAAAARARHAVVMPLDEAGPGRENDVVRLEPLCRRSAAEAFREIGLDRDQAYKMAGLARRSLTAFRRSMAASPAFRQPDWSKPAVARGLLPALLAGSWREGNAKDCEVVSGLARKPYEEVVELLVRWSVGSDPLVRRKDDGWYLVSAQDAWHLLGQYIIPSDLRRFETTAETVLRSVHPAFELPPEQRWMAGALGYSAEYSGFLSDGLVETVAIMGVHGGEVPSSTSSARRAAVRVVRKLLEQANGDWRLWASLSARLPLLAEAAPDCFLDAVETGLAQPESPLLNLFTSGGDPTFGSHHHTGLLWALETLAWSADHLGRIAPLLARLDQFDPVNRPLAVLKEVFRSWAPQTSASIDERLAVLDSLRASHVEVAWRVMRSMLPQLHSVGDPTSRPSVREWGRHVRSGVGVGERARTVSEVVLRMLEDAGSNGRRWADLIGRLDMLPRGEHDLVVAALKQFDCGELEADERNLIWEALRATVARHRAYSTANWAMPEEYLARLDEIRERFTPADPVALHGWLFGPGREVEDTPWEEHERRLSNDRAKAVVNILQRGGMDKLARFAQAVDDAYEVGVAAARAPSALLPADEMLSRHLGSQHRALRKLASGYVRGIVRRCGDVWVIRQLKRAELDLTPDQRVELLQVLPARANTWREVAACGDDIAQGYWRRMRPRRIDDKDLAAGVVGLLEAGRPFVAADRLAFDDHVAKSAVPPELVARLLDAAASASGDHDSPSAYFGSSAGFLLDVLMRASYDRGQVARLEWRLMPALIRHSRKPEAIHDLLSQDPAFFVEMVSVVFASESEKQEEVSLGDERRAQYGYSVLAQWRTIPGVGDGVVHTARLREWLDQAQRGLARTGRIRVGHQMIGQVLSASPNDPDGTWPCTAVRGVIEHLASEDLEQGFEVGVYNNRGVVTRDPLAGGVVERTLAEQYEGFAVAVRMANPRTARMLRKIAKCYRRDASLQDVQSEVMEER